MPERPRSCCGLCESNRSSTTAYLCIASNLQSYGASGSRIKRLQLFTPISQKSLMYCLIILRMNCSVHLFMTRIRLPRNLSFNGLNVQHLATRTRLSDDSISGAKCRHSCSVLVQRLSRKFLTCNNRVHPLQNVSLFSCVKHSIGARIRTLAPHR